MLDDGNIPKDQTNSFVFQVDTYVADVKKGLFPNLSAKDSLYHMEFGINDINTAGAKYSSLESSIFDKYQSTFERVCYLVMTAVFFCLLKWF